MSDYWIEVQHQQQEAARQRAERDRIEAIHAYETTSPAPLPGTSFDPIAPVAAVTPSRPEYRDDDRLWQDQQHDAYLERVRDDERRQQQRWAEQLLEEQLQETLLRQRLDEQKRQADAAYEQARQEERLHQQDADQRHYDQLAQEQRMSEERAACERLNAEVQERMLDQLRQERERIAAILEQTRLDDERQAAARQAQLLDDARAAASRDDATATAHVGDQYRQAEADAWAADDRQRSDAAAAVQGLEMLRQYAASYQLPLAETPQLRQLWEQAAAGDRSYDDARDRFWQQVNHGNDANAQYARAMLEAANYQIRQDRQPPLLNLPTGSRNPNLDYQDRVLTLDHATAQSDAAQRATDAANLRFMTGRDNSFRGNRYAADDQPKRPWPWRR